MSEIEARMGEPLRLGELAAAAGLSTSRFRHLFREETGVSPVTYLRQRRMERARILLQRTFLNVKEVMAQVGVRDQSHFARDFRRHHGMSPREVREARQQCPARESHGPGA